MQDLFADRLGNVTIAAGVARLDFLRVETLNPEKKQVSFAPSIRLAIPVAGLMQMVQMLDQLRDEIAKQSAVSARQRLLGRHNDCRFDSQMTVQA